MLAEELPEREENHRDPVDSDKREHIIELLQHAAEELGKSPTLQEFDSMKFELSGNAVIYAFGTWNEAKEAAGLGTSQQQTTTAINETYFREINTVEKAYWLGTLFATSSLNVPNNTDNPQLQIGRSEEKAFFVTEFSEAIESDYKTYRYEDRKSDNLQYNHGISNSVFINHLRNAGYPDPDEEPGDLPSFEEPYRSTFLRGFLESNGYFSNGWNVVVENIERAETLQHWFEEYGAKRPTVSETVSSGTVVRVSNAFDIRAIFDSLWPDVLETEPSWKPYPEQVLQHLESEHPYPENVSYLHE